MNKRRQYILLLAGIMSTIFGAVYSIPAFLQNKLTLGIITTLLIIGGLVLIALAFGEE